MPAQRDAIRLSLLFGTLYFVQGIAEPTEGLISQPMRALLKDWGHGAAEIAAFTAILSIPWAIKPIYGLICDFVPLFGSRRRGWLILTTAITTLMLFFVWLVPPQAGAAELLLWALLIPAVAVAFSDVVADALMVEHGQALGMTGRFQSVQWGALYAAMMLTGWLGGWLSQNHHARFGFLICAGAALLSLIVTLIAVREPEVNRFGTSARQVAHELRALLRRPVLLGITVFLFLWNFNPFTASVRYMHMTVALGMSEQFYGNTVSLDALAAIIASVCYGFYCRRLSAATLLHLTVAFGVLSTIAWWLMVDQVSALMVSFGAGFVYMTATLTQLDLAARACPPHLAGTVFALLMAIANLATAAAIWLGGHYYERFSAKIGAVAAFDILVGIGALCTAACWFVVPYLIRSEFSSSADANDARA